MKGGTIGVAALLIVDLFALVRLTSEAIIRHWDSSGSRLLGQIILGIPISIVYLGIQTAVLLGMFFAVGAAVGALFPVLSRIRTSK